MKAVQTYYILITLYIYWTDIYNRQNSTAREYIRTDELSERGIHDFCVASDKMISFINMYARRPSDIHVSFRSHDSTWWSTKESADAFNRFRIRAEDLNIEHPFGAVASHALWDIYIKNYMKPIIDNSEKLEVLGYQINTSAWLNCFNTIYSSQH